MEFDTGRGPERRDSAPERPGQGGEDPDPRRRLLLAFLLGILCGALLVSLFSLVGRFGTIPSYLLTGIAAVGAGYVAALVAGRYEVPVAALSTVVGVLLVTTTFLGRPDDGNPQGTSEVASLLALGIPLVISASVGGLLAEVSRRRGLPFGAGARTSPLVLVGIVAGMFVVLGLFANLAGFFEETPSEALESAYRAANKGDYEEANGYLSSRVLRGEPADGPPTDEELRASWDASTRNRTASRISVYNEVVEGREARVEVSLSFGAGGSSGMVVRMAEEDGRWKIDGA